MAYPRDNELMSKAQMAALIAAISGDEAPDAAYPNTNELPSREQAEALIDAIKDFIEEHGGGDLPAVTAADNGKALMVADGAWKAGSISHPKGVAVADAAGDNPTAAEFKALLDSLRTAGIIATT